MKKSVSDYDNSAIGPEMHKVRAMSLRAKHSWRDRRCVVVLFSHGARMSRSPREQASINSPPGLVNGVKLMGERKIRGKWAFKAARITLFSPSLIDGETRTVPAWASLRYCDTFVSISSSLKLREHCTCLFNGLSSKNLLPMAAYFCPATFIPKRTLNKSGCSRLASNRRGLSAK